ncbi:MAG: hypothetical protein WBA22_19890 [Candidatus Methanofastidiosia archaeon]
MKEMIPMNLLKKAYEAKKRVLYLMAIEVVVIISLFSFVFSGLEVLRGHPYLCFEMGYFLGCLFAIFSHELIWKAFRPAARMCEHFFILDHDHRVVEWDKIESVKSKEKSLNLHVPEERGRTYFISLSNIENAEELIEDARNMCRAKGITFEIISEDTEKADFPQADP